MPSAVASAADTDSSVVMAAGSQLLASPGGTWKIV